MDYRERPGPAGAGVACVWRARLPGDAAAFTQVVVPDGCVDLIWWDGAILVAGPDTGPMPSRIEPGAELAAVRLAPGRAAPVLGVPLASVRDARVPLRELWGDEAARLADAADPLAALTDAVVARSAPDPRVPALLDALARSPVRAAARELGLGERQLHRRAVALFGYGPKTVQRVLRFQRALRLARSGMPLAETAYAAGYADQPHLAHEARELAGVPITRLL
ncbi:helix-turn-helix transcriptional regulator [Actinomadura flavalba]|uniref:helix-turn-helix transcriptional regulator n=1 Tax=Actinomadura flavalba TaxID=1120938 RepID=UPI000370C3B7|nr:helix-turn-helix domain-containing protein [Actinomadura flavalba]